LRNQYVNQSAVNVTRIFDKLVFVKTRSFLWVIESNYVYQNEVYIVFIISGSSYYVSGPESRVLGQIGKSGKSGAGLRLTTTAKGSQPPVMEFPDVSIRDWIVPATTVNNCSFWSSSKFCIKSTISRYESCNLSY
jgi:hypothetical protein